MKNIACFCIPAHGHTNPMTVVAAALVRRGNRVRFYSFREFEGKITAAGAEFVPCDEFLPEVNARQMARLMKVSTTEMSLQDIRSTVRMNSFLDAEYASFKPDVVFTDSVCFWGKLSAMKHRVPMVVSTSTFAFNSLSSSYMKHSFGEMLDILGGMPRLSRELKKLKPYGYDVKNVMSLVQNDNSTDTVVYASREYQPYSESFSGHYAFVGPALMTDIVPDKKKERPLIYISMGTVINDRPDLYRNCIAALGDLEADVLISCGRAMDPAALAPLPANVQVQPYVNQQEVLSRADVFISHCGMNSASESLYMAAPMVLYPQTGEQQAVARRVKEMGAGVPLGDDSAKSIRAAALEILNERQYAQAAARCSESFRACPGAEGAAAFIETAPHTTDDPGVLGEVQKRSGLMQLGFWTVMTAFLVLLGTKLGWGYAICLSVIANIVFPMLNKRYTERIYKHLAQARQARRKAD